VICRQSHIRELADFVNDKLHGIKDPSEHLALICGDFNVNSLPETEDTKRMILKAHSENSRYLELAASEYAQMMRSLEGGQPGSIIDLVYT